MSVLERQKVLWPRWCTAASRYPPAAKAHIKTSGIKAGGFLVNTG